MLRNFLLSMIVLLPLMSVSQSYHKLIEENKWWDQACYTGGSVCNIDSGKAYRYFFQGDTLLDNGKVYSKLHYYGMLPTQPLYCPPFYVGLSSFESNFYLREDTLQRKIYIYGNSQEELVYDFNLNAGDTLNSLYAGGGVLQTVDSIAFEIFPDGSNRKVIYLQNGYYYIEGIGSPTAGLGYPMPPFWMGGGCYMLCVKQNGIDLTGSVCNSVPLAIGENMNPEPVQIFTYPEEQRIKVIYDGICHVTLAEMTGKVIYKVKFNSEFNKSFNLTRGVFLLTVENEYFRISRKISLMN